ncbi:MAG: hypothetical protein PHY93_00340 [Bacteriovorax sp.]|nr:hypothetical protein [Bacteriovorax sp.]
MKKIILIALVSTLTFNLVAQAVPPSELNDSPYRNMREGNSRLINSSKETEISKLYKNTKSIEVLRKIISDKSINRCATKVVLAIKDKLNFSHRNDVELAILGLRQDNSIDDITANILTAATSLNILIPNLIAKNDLTSDEEDKALEIFNTEAKHIKNKTLCIEDVYRDLVGKLATDSSKFVKNLKHINKLALDNNVINNNDFKILEKLRAKKVYEWPITLSEYSQSLDNIAINFPMRTRESAELITDVKFRVKKSLRQSLYEKYNSIQIMLLANIARDMKKRLESRDITININYVDQNSEIINLSPMEKFRFILKLLRKELATVNNGSLLGGKAANYMDIITASYEVGYISSNEITAMASLQEIWNPTKTTKEKVMYWTKTFGGIASVLLPPPFGFVAVMAIMLIDQQVAAAPIDHDSDFNLM